MTDPVPSPFAPAVSASTLADAARVFAETGRVRIEPALHDEAARSMYDWLVSGAEWWRALNHGEKGWDLGPQSIAMLTGDKEAELLALVHRNARDGFQFIFDNVRVSDDPAERQARALPVDLLVDALNGPAWLQLFRDLTGVGEISRVDGQATRYLAGHFLTGHDDAVEGKGRIAAYVLSLNPQWRTEWGGLLQFHDDEGDLTGALRPRFNALHIFRVPQVHSVSQVTPSAGAPRYSITGWLRI